MYSKDPYVRGPAFGGLRPAPRDVWILLGVLFATFSLNHLFRGSGGDPLAALSAGPLTELFGLTPKVYKLAFLWQLVTYPFIGVGSPDFWFLLELFILYMFAGDIFRSLGRKGFWQLLVTSAFGAALIAVVAEVILTFTMGPTAGPFVLMQGQRILLVILIAAFATLFGEATIYFMFVIPMRARWFLYLPILFGFLAFLRSQDLAGFLGICAGVALTYGFFVSGGLLGVFQKWRLRLMQRRYEWELKRMSKKRNLRIIRDDDRDDDRDRTKGGGPTKGPWVN